MCCYNNTTGYWTHTNTFVLRLISEQPWVENLTVDQVFCIASVVLNSSIKILYRNSIKVLILLTTFVYICARAERVQRLLEDVGVGSNRRTNLIFCSMIVSFFSEPVLLCMLVCSQPFWVPEDISLKMHWKEGKMASAVEPQWTRAQPRIPGEETRKCASVNVLPGKASLQSKGDLICIKFSSLIPCLEL